GFFSLSTEGAPPVARARTTQEDKREKARLRKRKERAKKDRERRERPILADAVYDLVRGNFSEYLQAHFDPTFEEGLHAGGIIFEGELREEVHSGVYPEDELWEEDF